MKHFFSQSSELKISNDPPINQIKTISSQRSATRVQSQHAGFSARARFARVLACNLLIFKNPARARRARVLSVRVLRAHAFCTQKQNKENSTGGVMERPSSEIACTQYFRFTVTKLTLRSNSRFIIPITSWMEI